jgi:hypothetical protein
VWTDSVDPEHHDRGLRRLARVERAETQGWNLGFQRPCSTWNTLWSSWAARGSEPLVETIAAGQGIQVCPPTGMFRRVAVFVESRLFGHGEKGAYGLFSTPFVMHRRPNEAAIAMRAPRGESPEMAVGVVMTDAALGRPLRVARGRVPGVFRSRSNVIRCVEAPAEGRVRYRRGRALWWSARMASQ